MSLKSFKKNIKIIIIFTSLFAMTISLFQNCSNHGFEVKQSSLNAGSSVNPNSDLPKITQFAASPTKITAGNSSTLSWTVSGATMITIDGVNAGTTTTKVITPTATQTYRLVAANSSGSVNASVTVTVNEAEKLSVTLAWDPNNETTLAGYKIYYGTSPMNYTSSINAGLPPTVGGAVSYNVPNLTPGTTYYFAVAAYDTSQAESAKSNEVSKLVSASN